MKKNQISIAMLCACAMVSCKKASEVVTSTATVTTTSQIKAPTGFTWQNSRSINFTINVTDTRFPKISSVISLYDADPNNGGNLLVKGAALNASSFKSSVYISNQITLVYLVKTSPDITNTIQKISIGTADVTANIGN